MNAKTTKFLAVFAVLAMAFAAVAVFAPAESDADEAQSEWTTPDVGGDNWSLVLGTDVIIPTDGQTLDEKKVYYVNTDMSLVMSKDADLSVGGTLILLKSGVHIKVQVPETHENLIAYAVAGVDESEDEEGNTVLTFYGNYTGTDFENWVPADKKGFDYPTAWEGAGDIIVGNQTVGLAKDKGGNFEFESGVTVDGEMTKVVYLTYVDIDCDWYGDKGYFSGTFQYVYQYEFDTETEAIWNLKEATGTIGSYYENNKLKLNNFTGVVKMTEEDEIIIEKWISGDIEVIAGTFQFDEDAKIAEGSKITFAQGTTVPDGFRVSFVRYVVDKYTFTNAGTLKAGVSGFTIAAGENGFEISGSATATTAGSWTFKGAAKISGILNMDGKAFEIKKDEGDKYQITLEDFRADNASAGLTLSAETVFESQVTVSGKVIAGGSMIVAPYAFVNITGEYNFVPTADNVLYYTFVGKDATLRVSQAVGPTSASSKVASSYTSDDSRWATFGFVDITGKFFLNQNLVTKTSGAVISYLYQIGEGQVSVNSSICSIYSTYYLYKQVIPYLLLNPVDVVCTSLIAEKAEISLDKVDYTETPVSTGNQARYSIDYSTGVPELTVVFKELYPVNIEGAYDENGAAKIEVIDEDGQKVFMEPDKDDPTIGIVNLAYDYDYIVKGVNDKNKYTFYFDEDELDAISLYASALTMVRGYTEYGAADNIPPVITYDEGLAVEVTVVLDDEAYNQYAEGEVFMHFTTEVDEEGNPVGGTPVTLESIKVKQKSVMGAVIKSGIYSTDTVYFKSEYKLFYKLTAVNADSEKISFPGEPTPDTVDLSTKEWSEGFTFTDNTVEKATLGVDCVLNTVDVVISLDVTGATSLPANKKVYIDFTTFCDKQISHLKKEKIEITPNTEPKTITMCVGEVYEITWDDIDGKFMDMSYVKTDADNPVTAVYDKGTSVTATSTGLTYKLKIEDISYITVVNQTEYDLTITIGKYTADIAKGKTNNKVIVNDGDKNPAILSKKGYTIDDWKFQTKENTDPVSSSVYVSGTMTVKDVVMEDEDAEDGYFSRMPASQDTFTLTILETHVKIITYTIDVEADDHATITNYDDSGQLGQLRKAYVQPHAEYTVIDVEYEYQEVGMTEKAVGHAVKRTSETTGQKYWEFVMPASNVVLKPISQKETRNLSFVDENGEPIEDAIKVEPTTPVNMPVPCKPLYKIVEVTTEPTVEGFNYNPETGNMTFTMPDADVKVIITCEKINYSENVTVAIGQTGADVNFIAYSNDQNPVGPGVIKYEINYVYYDEEFDMEMLGVYEGEKTYTATDDDATFIKLVVDDIAEKLGDNYLGAYSITGEYQFGEAEGNLNKTVYNPVEA